MNDIVQGSCLCGQCGYSSAAEVKFAIQCYCTDCQHISGGGHLPQIAMPTEGFATSGPVKSYKSTSESGSTVELVFCGDCGSPLFKSTTKRPDIKFLCAGSLAEDLVAEPFNRIFEDSQRIWDA